MVWRVTKLLVTGSWWIFLLAIFLGAAYLGLGKLATYAVSSYPERVEDYLRSSGLSFVSISEVSDEWQTYDPILQVIGLSLSTGGGDAVEIDDLKIRLDSFRSLITRTPIVAALELSGVRFTVEKEGDDFWVRGLQRGDKGFSLDRVLDSLPHLHQVQLNEVEITFIEAGYELQILSGAGEPWIIQADGESRQVSIPIHLERMQSNGEPDSNRISLFGSYQGDFRNSDFVAEFYLQVQDLAIEYLPLAEQVRHRISNAALSTNAWLKVGTSSIDVTADVALVNASNGDLKLFDSFTSTVRFKGRSITEGQLSIPELRLRQDDAEFVLNDLQLVIGQVAEEEVLTGRMSTLNVQTVVDLIAFAHRKALVPDSLVTALSVVGPKGELKDIMFSHVVGSRSQKIVGEVANFSMSAYLGLPAISHLNGFVSLQADRGYLDIDNNAFQLNFSNMFDEAWPFDSGRGRVAYRVEDGVLKVSSGLIELLVDDLTAYGKVAINLPEDKSKHTWGLTLGIANAPLAGARRFLPKTIPRDLTEWLDGAIKGGNSSESGLTIHGALFRGAPVVRKSHDVYLKVEQTELSYDPSWPPLVGLAGTVHIDSHFVKADGIIGKVYDSAITAADLLVPIDSEGKVGAVFVVASVRGPFSDGVRVLNETPLSESISNLAETWIGEGDMSATVGLEIPLGERSGEEVVSVVNVTYTDAALVMPDYELVLTELEGSAKYTTSEGISSPSFRAMLFDQTVRGTIESKLFGAGGEVTVSVDGQISAKDLYDWTDQILLSRAQGITSYQTHIHIPYGGDKDEPYIEASSDLAGLTLDLPHPLKKSDAKNNHKFEYRQVFTEPAYRVEVSIDDMIRGSLKVEEGMVVGGKIHFGTSPFGAVAYDAIRMSGHLAYLDYQVWEDAIDQLSALSEVSIEDEISEHVDDVSLTIDELQLFDLQLDKANLYITRENSAWKAMIENEMLGGVVRIEDDVEIPLAVDLEYLRFDSEGESGDPFVDVDPLAIGAVNFKTKELTLGKESYGSWSFNYRIADQVALFENLTAAAGGVNIVADSLIEWRYDDDKHSSRFSGEIIVEDLAVALTKFGYASSIEGQGLKIHADFGWDGSPAMVDVDQVTGTVAIEEGKGRFVQAETGGALKLLGIFDFSSIARRFRLDFSDVVEKGFQFDSIRGVTSFDRGVITVQDPIVIDGSSGRFKVAGSVDLNNRTLDNDVIVTLPVGRTLPWYAAYSAIVTGPLAGAGVMLAQKVFQNQIDQISSAKYKISGTIEEPNIEFIAIFDDQVREAPAE